MKIALDFDSVLSDTMVRWVHNYNNRYETSFSKKHVTKWAFWSDFNIDRNEAFTIFEETWEQWEHLPPTEEQLSEKTEKLNKIGQVDIVSNVSSSHIDFVKKWLEKQKIHYNDFVNSCNDKEKLEYDYFIDDSPSLAHKLNELQKSCLLYHQQWNVEIQGKHIINISNLNQALDKIKDKNL